MNRKNNIILIIALSLTICIISCKTQKLEQNNKKAPSFQGISIISPSGWLLLILPDGSGYIMYGAGPSGSAAKFKKETFSVEEEVRLLLNSNKARKNGSIAEDFSIGIKYKNIKKTDYSTDYKLIKKLFDKALHAVDKKNTNLELLYKEKPLIIHNKINSTD